MKVIYIPRRALLLAAFACICSLLYAGVTVPTYNLENTRVRAFLKEVTYRTTDVSKVGNYNSSPPSRRDQPAPVSLEWKAATGAASLKLTLSTSATYANPQVINLNADASSCDIYNLIPGKTYYYKVDAIAADGTVTNVAEASFATEGSLRMIKADTGYNMRDLGGWNTRSGKKIRYGMIYRGAEWDGKYELNSEDSATIHDLGIRAELDLRGNSEANYVTVSRIGNDDVEYMRIPTVTYYIEGIKANNSRFADQLNFIFRCVKEGKPVYFHCHIGADRTGCLGFLIEGLLGVSESDIFKDYELTTFSALGTPRGKGQIEDMMQYIKTFEGTSLEEQFFSYCTQGLKLNPVDIQDFKSTMLQYTFINAMDFDSDTISVEPGETLKLDPTVTPDNASKLTITYTSSDPRVATITSKGTLTGVRGGTTVITAKSNVISKDVVIVVPFVESEMPEFVSVDGMDYTIIGPNLIANGSFEYAHPLTHWTTGIGSAMEEHNYQLRSGSQWGDIYLQSTYDADDESARSIRAMWPIEKDKSYVMGYRVKTADGQTVSANPYLRTSLVSIGGSGFTGGGDDFIWDDEEETGSSKVQGLKSSILQGSESSGVVGADDEGYLFPFPTYGRNWADIVYVFTNTEGYTHCQVWFSHLSKGDIHTCLDNFYLAEVSEGEPTAIRKITTDDAQSATLSPQATYDLQGRRVNIDTKSPNGLYIKDRKIYKAH